jgi:hypothetical protein
MSAYFKSPPCWEIVQCNRKDQCLLIADKKKPCWEVVKDDDACSFHICVDCVVYLVNQEASLLNAEEFYHVLAQCGKTNTHHCTRHSAQETREKAHSHG